MKKSYKIRYILKDVIFFSLGTFLKEGFETKWNCKDYQILWSYVIKKYSSMSFTNLKLLDNDLINIGNKLKKECRPKRKEAIKSFFDNYKELYMESSNRQYLLEKYLNDYSLKESKNLEDFFMNIQIKKEIS